MGNIKDSKSESTPQPNNASTDWREIEYRECSEDWRHRDRLIWATLPVAATVGAVIVGVAYGQIPYCKLDIRFFLLLFGVFLTLVMLISLVKHRLYQQGSEKQIRSIQVQLNIEAWGSPRIHRPFYFGPLGIIPNRKIDASLTNWASRRSGFKWMLGGTLIVLAVLVGLAIHTFVQWVQ